MNSLRRVPSLLLVLVLWSAIRVSAQSTDPSEIYFAHFARGNGYSTTFTLMNTGTTDATGILQLYDTQGNPLIPTQVIIPARGTNSVTSGGGVLRTGWGKFVGEGGKVTGVATFLLQERGVPKAAAAVLGARPMQSASIPARVSLPEEEYMSYALANPGTTPITLTVRAYSSEGVPIGGALTVDLAPGQQRARFLHETLPPDDVDFFDGSIQVVSQSGEPFIAVALSQVKGLLTVLPVVGE